jgi:O-antigen/teichoic acid export membrane protein
VPIAPSRPQPRPVQPVSLRRNFAWIFSGYVVAGICQWGVLSVIAKLGTSQMLGEYALALAVIAPVTMLSHLNLRAVLATDIDERHGFGDYLAVRLWTTGAVVLVIGAIALASGYGYTVSVSMVLIGLSLSADIVSDIYYAALQRGERMREIAASMMARGILALIAFGAVLVATGRLAPAVAMLTLARIVVLLAYDRFRGSRGQTLARAGTRVQWEIFRTALPLGVVLMLVSFTGNVPRYAVEHYLGTRELGVFAAVAAFLTAGTTVANALGQSATPRLARHFSRRELSQFRLLALKLAGLAVGLGAAGVLFAALAGDFVLRILYRAEFGAYGKLLVEVMAAGTCVFVAVVLGYVITSARSFLAQMPLLAAVATTAAVASWLLVPARGLSGAALAVAIAACLQIAGSLLILRRALARPERAA